MIKVTIDFSVWANLYSLGCGELTLWFKKDEEMPQESTFKDVDILFFSGMYDSLFGEDIMTYYKVEKPKFIKSYIHKNEDYMRFKFDVDDRFKELTKEEFYEETVNVIL